MRGGKGIRPAAGSRKGTLAMTVNGRRQMRVGRDKKAMERQGEARLVLLLVDDLRLDLLVVRVLDAVLRGGRSDLALGLASLGSFGISAKPA